MIEIGGGLAMKRIITCAVSVVLSILLVTVSFAESKEGGISWDLSVPTEISDEVRDVFDRAAGQLVGVGYEPVAFLGKAKSDEEAGTVYCLLCRATVIYPDAEPSYVLMYINEHEGGNVDVQNIWDIWVDSHALPSDPQPQAEEEESWPHSYLFSSGAGAWATEINMKDDWSFTGSFHDSDMGSSSEEYPDGTVYYCDFSGEFSVPEPAGTSTYKMHLNRLEQEGNKDEEHIDNEIRYICWEPYGLQDGDEFTLYAPGAPVSALTEDCLTWVHWYIDPENDESVPEGLYIIYNEKGKTAFVGMNDDFQYDR